MKQRQILFSIFLTGLLAVPVIAGAAPLVPECAGPDCTIYDFAELIRRVIVYVITAGIVISPVFFAWAGFLFITAQGKIEKLQKARQIMTSVVIGLIILIAAFALVDLLAGTLGLNSEIRTLINKVF
jgi:hypothetical protein